MIEDVDPLGDKKNLKPMPKIGNWKAQLVELISIKVLMFPSHLDSEVGITMAASMDTKDVVD